VRRVAGECFEDELMENKNKMYVKKVVNIYIFIYKRRLNCYGILVMYTFYYVTMDRLMSSLQNVLEYNKITTVDGTISPADVSLNHRFTRTADLNCNYYWSPHYHSLKDDVGVTLVLHATKVFQDTVCSASDWYYDWNNMVLSKQTKGNVSI
jgi:hypothetical protein